MHVMANSGWSWHLFAAPAIWVSHLQGTPAVINYRGGEAEQFLSRTANLVKLTVRRADALVVPSGFLREVFARWRINAQIVPNIIDLERFRPGDVPLSARPPHVVIARNLEPIYDIPTALRAFARAIEALPSITMTIAGSGAHRPELERLAGELRIERAVRFAGQLGREEVAELYRNASALLNPSRVDNMPNSVLEAMASGIPIVSTRAGGIPYVVEDRVSALLVDVGDDRAMADALLRVHQDSSAAQALVDAGRKEVAKYAWSHVRDGWLTVYESAIKGSRMIRATAPRGGP